MVCNIWNSIHSHNIHKERSANSPYIHCKHTVISAQCCTLYLQRFGEESSRSLPAISTSAQPQLPAGWNSSQDVYALQYRHRQSGEICLVKVVPLGDQLLLNAVVRCDQLLIFSVVLNMIDIIYRQPVRVMKCTP